MRRFVLLIAVGLLAAPGCGSHKPVVRPAATVDPAADRAANDERPPQRINNGESETVKNWGTGGP